MKKSRKLCLFFWIFVCVIFVGSVWISKKQETIRIEFFYENVCASCDGTADFYKIYDTYVKETSNQEYLEVVTYNIFLDSCKKHYEEISKDLEIPKGSSMPVMVIGKEWVSGYENIETALAGSFSEKKSVYAEGLSIADEEQISENEIASEKKELISEIYASEEPIFLLFTTEACNDCEQVKEWLGEMAEDINGKIIECNIIEKSWLEVLKGLFRTYNVAEKNQKVPAMFYGDNLLIGKENIMEMDISELTDKTANTILNQKLEEIEKTEQDWNLLTLATTGFLAGWNPCSISMLLMLLSLIVGEQASVWKNGSFYMIGKYVTYFLIGIGIYFTASRIDSQSLQGMSRIINGILVILFFLAGLLYLADAVRIYRQDYGKIKTQLPTNMRRWNHKMIKNAWNYSGMLKPLLIIGLGMGISVGEFFCTGQIYMASIVYLLSDRVDKVWIYFLVYVTAMSLPAVLMIMIIQKTRNTAHISEFMLRHLGVVKIFNALLFFVFMGYFILQ